MNTGEEEEESGDVAVHVVDDDVLDDDNDDDDDDEEEQDNMFSNGYQDEDCDPDDSMCMFPMDFSSPQVGGSGSGAGRMKPRSLKFISADADENEEDDCDTWDDNTEDCDSNYRSRRRRGNNGYDDDAYEYECDEHNAPVNDDAEWQDDAHVTVAFCESYVSSPFPSSRSIGVRIQRAPSSKHRKGIRAR